MNSPKNLKENGSSTDKAKPDNESIQSSKFDLYEAKGNIAFQQQQFDIAVENYQLALDISPNANLYMQLARALKQKKEDKACLEAQYQALKLDPSLASAKEAHLLGNALEQVKQEEAALDCYQIATEKDDGIDQYYISYAKRLLAIDKKQKAKESYRKALELNPSSLEANLFFGKFCREQDQKTRAARHYLRVLQQQPDNAEAYVWLRYNYLRYYVKPEEKILNKVIQTCRAILEQVPNQISINSLLGYALSRKGHQNRAVEYYQKASQHKAKVLNPHIPSDDWNSATSSEPTFIVLGGFKCATTSLYKYITTHPKVITPLEKELDFFDREYHQGVDWYLSHFAALPPSQGLITGEATPNYLYSIEAPLRIKQHFPSVKLIVVLRNPVERAFSHYYFLPQNNTDPAAFSKTMKRELKRLETAFNSAAPPHQVLRNCPYLGNGLYEIHLNRWLQHFSSEQLLLLPVEYLSGQPEQAMKETFEFLGLPNHGLEYYQRHKKGHYPNMPEQIRGKLESFFKPHNDRLNKLLTTVGAKKIDW